MSTFSEKIDEHCRQRGIARSKMCDDIGISRSLPLSWDQGTTPRNSTIKKIAAYFNVAPEFFTEESPDRDVLRIPVLGRVAAGLPMFANEDIIDWEEAPKAWEASGDYFGLKIKGRSMEPRICDGDVVIVRKQDYCNNGQIAIVLVNGEDATCKRVMFTDDGITLVPLNPLHPKQEYSTEAIRLLPVTILGVVVELRGKFE